MNTRKTDNHRGLLACLLIVLLATACTTPKNISYFQDVQNGQTMTIAYNQGIKLRAGDKISIVVKSKSVELSNVLNLPVTAQMIGTPEETSLVQSQGMGGYTLDRQGDIDFPIIGKIHLAGKDKLEVAAYIKQLLYDQQIATDAVVTVEYQNLRYAVLGEVTTPGQYNIDKEHISILEALGKAGDMTIYGRRDSIIVWRENEGQRQTYVLNVLNGKELGNSPAYYLQQGDIVYVQPNDFRKRQSKANGNEVLSGSFWLSAVSVLTTVGVLLFK